MKFLLTQNRNDRKNISNKYDLAPSRSVIIITHTSIPCHRYNQRHNQICTIAGNISSQRGEIICNGET